jgi:hypothetical protein
MDSCKNKSDISAARLAEYRKRKYGKVQETADCKIGAKCSLSRGWWKYASMGISMFTIPVDWFVRGNMSPCSNNYCS